ncbi:hypothetical protein LCGC14_1156790 [marine sediment metagenome]|uniref:Uncharacterized protein n=2 Tax=root TaxID=1 RepID=A0A0F9PZC1_9ZZZZ
MPQHNDKSRLMRLATYASVLTAVTLISAKIVAWFVSDSVSILATLIDSSLDVLASIVNMVAVHHALQPADKEHRFGHGKAEALAGLGQSMFIAGSAGVLLLQAIHRLLHPQPLQNGIELGMVVMVFSIVMTLLLITFQNYVIARTDSSAIRADALHYRTDLLVNATVIAALLLSLYGWQYMDSIFAILIAVYIVYSAWEIIKESIDLLMDHEISNDDRALIQQIILSHPKSRGMHDLRTRRSGTTVFVQLHLEMDRDLTLLEAHSITEDLEQKVIALFGDAEVIIHEDPYPNSSTVLS